MGRQLNQIIEGLSAVTGATSTINVNLDAIEALLTTLQADVADGITISGGTSTFSSGTITTGTVTAAQATHANLKAQAQILDSSGNQLTYAATGTAGVPSSDVISIQGISGGVAAPVSFTGGTLTNGTVSVTSGTLTTGTMFVRPLRGTTTNGTLTAGTTNGTLFATNSTRNYLLVQCTSGTVFIDTNGTATTTDGIQLTSGQGITFEGSFIPTGAIAGITSTGTGQLIGRQG